MMVMMSVVIAIQPKEIGPKEQLIQYFNKTESSENVHAVIAFVVSRELNLMHLPWTRDGAK